MASCCFPNISAIKSLIALVGIPRFFSSFLRLSLKWEKHLRNKAGRKLRFSPSVKAFSPSVPHANNPSSSEHSVVRKLPNLAYVFQSICWWKGSGPMKTGGVFVVLLCNFRFRFVGIRLMFSSNMLNVGCTPKKKKSFGLVQNRLRSSNWRFIARIARKSSGWTLHSLMKIASLEVSSSRFASPKSR